ncbi:hypothetical protein [Bifidobacterium myosotis]|uniref:hypothetical protein n=1 Tax=Bifidobacterium myosotis TaxID=1630166 RepID=UPI001CC2A536|nr:hypothetical protein [Bifidobacterium myosotis]
MAHDIIPQLTQWEYDHSLGNLAVWWIETFTVIGRGDGIGLPMHFDLDEYRFMVGVYALKRDGRRKFDRTFLSRSKGRDKSGKAAGVGLFEGFGPCRFDHWAHEGETYTFMGETYVYAEGEPVGRPVKEPEVVCMANSESQAGNVFDSIYYNCDSGPLSDLKGMGLDVGTTRIFLPEMTGGGVIMPITSGASSQDGKLTTCGLADETHLMVQPKQWKVYKTVARNLGKRAGTVGTFMFETSTMYKPGEGSVAESSYKYAWDQAAGRIKHGPQIFFDHVYGNLDLDEFSDEKKMTRALEIAYGQSVKSTDGKDHILLPNGDDVPIDPDTWLSEDGRYSITDGELGPSRDGWLTLEGQLSQIYQPDTDPADSIRYFLNNLSSAQNAWLAESDIQSHILYRREMETFLESPRLKDAWKRFVTRKEPITLGFDGSVSKDSTALVGCRVSDGMIFLIRLEARPDGPEGADWKVDRDAFDETARRVMDEYNVVGFFADAAFFETMIAGWEKDYAKQLKYGPRKSGDLIKFYTNNWKLDMYRATENAATSFRYSYEEPENGRPVPNDIALLADPRLINHFRHAIRHEKTYGYKIYKETPASPDKIDACVAGVLAYQARARYLETGVKQRRAPIRIY